MSCSPLPSESGTVSGFGSEWCRRGAGGSASSALGAAFSAPLAEETGLPSASPAPFGKFTGPGP